MIHNNSVEFGEAHLQLRKEHPDVEFWQQGENIFLDLDDAVCESKNNYVCLFVDDCFVYNDISHILKNNAIDKIFNMSDVTCFSLRLGLNVCERSHDNKTFPDKLTNYGLDDTGEYVFWNRTGHCYGSYWSYSLSVDGHIFRKNDLQDMTYELSIISNHKEMKQTPNEIESALQRFWAITPLLMVCPRESAVVNSPNNKVQDSHDNRSGDVFEYDEKLLLEKYESGNRIDFKTIEPMFKLPFNTIKCPHTEIDILKGLK